MAYAFYEINCDKKVQDIDIHCLRGRWRRHAFCAISVKTSERGFPLAIISTTKYFLTCHMLPNIYN